MFTLDYEVADSDSSFEMNHSLQSILENSFIDQTLKDGIMTK